MDNTIERVAINGMEGLKQAAIAKKVTREPKSGAPVRMHISENQAFRSLSYPSSCHSEISDFISETRYLSCGKKLDKA